MPHEILYSSYTSKRNDNSSFEHNYIYLTQSTKVKTLVLPKDKRPSYLFVENELC